MTDPIPVRPTQCPTCIMRAETIRAMRRARIMQIQDSLLQGTSHLCHSCRGRRGGQAWVACRGGRDLQLQVWHRLGWIKAPTDDALADAMEAAGLAAWRPKREQAEG